MTDRSMRFSHMFNVTVSSECVTIAMSIYAAKYIFQGSAVICGKFLSVGMEQCVRTCAGALR